MKCVERLKLPSIPSYDELFPFVFQHVSMEGFQYLKVVDRRNSDPYLSLDQENEA